MTDPDLVLKKLALIETCLRALRTRARPKDLEDDFEHRALRVHVDEAVGTASLHRCMQIAGACPQSLAQTSSSGMSVRASLYSEPVGGSTIETFGGSPAGGSTERSTSVIFT